MNCRSLIQSIGSPLWTGSSNHGEWHPTRAALGKLGLGARSCEVRFALKTGRTRIEQMSSAVQPNNGHSAVLPCPLPTWRPAVFFLNSLPIGTTRTPQKSSRSCRTMNVASAIDRSGGRYMVGALSFSPFLKIGPIPTPRYRLVSSRASLPSLLSLAPGRCARCSVASCHRAVAMPRALSASTMALFFPRLPPRFTALRLISFRRRRRMNDSNGTAAHGAVEVSRFLPGVWRLVVPRAVLCLLTNHLRDPFCRQQPACVLPSVSHGVSQSKMVSHPARPPCVQLASVAFAQSKPAPA
jgi:hypothetical protein